MILCVCVMMFSLKLVCRHDSPPRTNILKFSISICPFLLPYPLRHLTLSHLRKCRNACSSGTESEVGSRKSSPLPRQRCISGTALRFLSRLQIKRSRAHAKQAFAPPADYYRFYKMDAASHFVCVSVAVQWPHQHLRDIGDFDATVVNDPLRGECPVRAHAPE